MTSLITLGQIEIPIIAAGNGWLVVEKPWGMSVHNDPGADLVSLARRAPGNGAAHAHQIVHAPELLANHDAAFFHLH